ncbi:MAG: fibro-slime domain-containing protein [Clostridia bacterium]|nr:fibro-slime domain-containing protein [Clostridia bacterium]
MKRIISGLILLMISFYVMPCIAVTEELDTITIKGTVFDQRSDYNIFNGYKYTGSYNNSIVANSMATDKTPEFLKYNEFYSGSTPKYTDRWFHDYSYNPLTRIKNLSSSIINSDEEIGNNIRIWTYKTMYLSLETAKKVVPETKASIGRNDYLLARNSDYIFSLIRAEKLLEKIENDLDVNVNAYQSLDSISSEHNKIFNNYQFPYNGSNLLFRANGTTIPSSLVIPTNLAEVKSMYQEMISDVNNLRMINDNTTMYYLNETKKYDITLIRNNDGMYEYISENFFIADNWGIGDDLDPNNSTNHFFGGDTKHNYLFTYSFNLNFKPKDGAEFCFTGDDDVWAYIVDNENPSSNFLVTNLGGIHPTESASFKFQKDGNDNLRCYIKDRNSSNYSSNPTGGILDSNKTYSLYLFFSERMPTGSNFKIVTDIEIQKSNKPVVTDNNGESLNTKNATSILKTLSEAPKEGAIYRLYSSQNGEEIAQGVSVEIVENKIKIIFDEVPQETVEYYLSVQNPNEKESERIKIIINPYEEPIIEEKQEEETILEEEQKNDIITTNINEIKSSGKDETPKTGIQR